MEQESTRSDICSNEPYDGAMANKRYSLKLMLTLVLLASALTCMVTSAMLIRHFSSPDSVSAAVAEYKALMELIDEFYIGDFNIDEVSAASLHAAVDMLGDSWSYYMTAEEYASYLDRVNNRYAGIGIGAISDVESGYIRVQYVTRNSAAEDAGFLEGDTIIEVDGEDIYGVDIEGLRALLSREIGETAIVTVMRSDGTMQELTVIYSYVFTDPVEFEMLENDVGYVSLANFDAGSADSFISAVDSLIGQGARAFVYDVRSNNGGLVSEMVRILDYLLPEGDIFVTIDKNGTEEVTVSDAASIDIPAAVLVNRHSYSAAEYFAAILREYGYAEVTGERTTGKSRMQITLRLPSGGALHISSSQYLTRNRVKLFDEGGLEPDYTVLFTDEEAALFASGRLEKSADTQLQAALSVLNFSY